MVAPSPSEKPPLSRKPSPLTSIWGGVHGAVILGLCVLSGSALGMLIVPRAPAPASNAPQMTPALVFLGKALELEPQDSTDPETAFTKLATERARDFLDKTFTVTVKGSSSIALPLSKWGVAIDEERLARLIADSLDPTSPQTELWQDQDANETKTSSKAVERELPLLIEIDRERAAGRLDTLKEVVDRPAQSARYAVKKKEVIPHQDGKALDIAGTIMAMVEAIEKGQDKTEASVIVTPPQRKTEELKKVSFPTVLGHFETRYSLSQKAEDRTYNLRLAAQRLDGTVLFPGETFDFNAVVGPRDEAHGYKVATVIANGELVDGIGGGTCQISGTLHGAAFFSGLDIVERYPHTRPSSYIKMGMDATVVYPTINFRFKNPFDFPVVIHERVQDGEVYAEIRGGQVDQVVSLIRKIDSAIPYEELERSDTTLPQGTRILAQRGVPGFRLHRYRTIRRGSHTTREKWRDIYPPTAQVVRVGIGDAQKKKRSSVKTPEYTADEVLILTQRRAEDGSPGDFAENREPGKYGKRGWTEEAGMPFWTAD